MSKAIEVTRDGDDRVIVKWAGVVLDITTANVDPGLTVEAYAFVGTPSKRIDREDWERGRFGPLHPGQVSTYRVREDD
jgi:hypothetical protein